MSALHQPHLDDIARVDANLYPVTHLEGPAEDDNVSRHEVRDGRRGAEGEDNSEKKGNALEGRGLGARM
jgi:hypothetical protein